LPDDKIALNFVMDMIVKMIGSDLIHNHLQTLPFFKQFCSNAVVSLVLLVRAKSDFSKGRVLINYSERIAQPTNNCGLACSVVLYRYEVIYSIRRASDR